MRTIGTPPLDPARCDEAATVSSMNWQQGQDFRWDGEVTEHATALEGIPRSQRHEVAGITFAVPDREDYASAFRSAGALAEGEALETNPALLAAAQAHWHADGNNACVFAAHMSSERERNGWETFVLAGRGGAAPDAEALDALVAGRVGAPEAEVVSVVLPQGDEPAYLAQLLRRLDQLPAWSITDEGQEEDAEFGHLQRIGLRVTVEFGYLSEVLGFGPFSAFGYTRRAPFTELAIRAKPPRKRPRDRRAFMAQVEIPGLEQAEFGMWWSQTKVNRAARLGTEHDERAKARVAYALPRAHWEEQHD